MNDFKEKSNSDSNYISGTDLIWLKSVGVDYYNSKQARDLKSEEGGNFFAKSPKLQLNATATATATAKSIDSEVVKQIPSSSQSAPLKLKSNNKQLAQSKQPETAFKSEALQEDSLSLSRKLADGVSTLDELRQIVMKFEGCDLKKFATNTVFADGKNDAKIMLIGEAPGASEDQQGIPFCGESGKLLDNMLACVNISRDRNAYITNTIFWRPPANRLPTEEEINICRPFVEKHIALINPSLIILVGNTAATSLLGKNAGVSKIRQEYCTYSNKYIEKPIVTTAIFHPAYLLRQPMQKKATWYDLIKIEQHLANLIK